MESGGSSAFSPPSKGNGASQFLSNLPTRGLFSSNVLSSNPGGMRVYVCDHDTSPPEDQVIKTNQTNILIRSLMLRNQKTDTKDGKSAMPYSRKRAAERALESKAAGKKAMSSQGESKAAGKKAMSSQGESKAAGKKVMSSQAGSSNDLPKNLQSMTVKELRDVLRARGLSSTGKKEELIYRLRG